MEGDFLEQLGFEPCAHCYSNNYFPDDVNSNEGSPNQVSEENLCANKYDKYIESYGMAIIAWEKKEQEIGGGHLWEDINSPPISDKAFIENCMIGVYVPSFMMSDGSIKKKLD